MSKSKKSDSKANKLVDAFYEKLSGFFSEDADQDEVKSVLAGLLAKEAKKGKKAKKAKDPDAPKKPGSAYILWCNKHREEVKEDSGVTGRELMKELGTRWKALYEKDKRPYEKEFKKAQEAFKEAKAAYDAEHPKSDEDSESEGKKEKRKADPNMPKQALSGYMLYCKDRRAESEEKIGTKELGADWKALSSEEQDEWKEKARPEQKKVAAARAEYKKERDAPKKKGEKAEKKEEKKEKAAKKPSKKEVEEDGEPGEPEPVKAKSSKKKNT
jgi:hypothetical protein